MKASQVEVEKVVKVTGIRLDMSDEEANALMRAIDRAHTMAAKANLTLDVDRFERLMRGLRVALDGREVTIQIEKQ